MRISRVEIRADALYCTAIANWGGGNIPIRFSVDYGELGAVIYKSLQEAAERGLIPKII